MMVGLKSIEYLLYLHNPCLYEFYSIHESRRLCHVHVRVFSTQCLEIWLDYYEKDFNFFAKMKGQMFIKTHVALF